MSSSRTAADRHASFRLGRVLAIQGLCQWDVQGDASIPDIQAWIGEQFGEAGAAIALKLLDSFLKNRELVDRTISESLRNWSLDRLSLVERNVIRCAAAELLQGETPKGVVLNEAIEIVREFGGGDSPQFVNGVLDETAKNLLSPERIVP